MRRIILLVLAVFVTLFSFAAPARRIPVKVKQSDGTEMSVVLNGDESFHFYSTLDGIPLVKEINGDFSYARLNEDGDFVSTELLAHEVENRTLFEESLLESFDIDAVKEKTNSLFMERSASHRAAMRAGSSIAPLGEINVAVVLVEFKDCKFTYTKDDINNLLNAKDFVYDNPIVNTIGSARD